MKIFYITDIRKIFINLVKVIYSGIKSNTIIVSIPFPKMSINIAQV